MTSRHHRPCPTGKVRFQDHLAAVHALHKAQTARKFAADAGAPCHRREIRCYACELCKGWHLTSKPDSRPSSA